MPDKLVDGPANFQYLIDNEKLTEGRLRFMPWEFLAFVVDHRTPLEERQWAKKYYQDFERTHKQTKDSRYNGLARWTEAVLFDGPLAYGEGAVVHAGQLLARGIDPYGPAAAGTFVGANYGPLAYVFVALGEGSIDGYRGCFFALISTSIESGRPLTKSTRVSPSGVWRITPGTDSHVRYQPRGRTTELRGRPKLRSNTSSSRSRR